MIKRLSVGFIYLINIVAIAYAQVSTPCSAFKNAKFKNDVDTIVIKAVYKEINPLAATGYIDKLDTEKRLRKKNFSYQIVFQPIGCPTQYFCPSSAETSYLVKPGNLGSLIYVTCVVFQKYKYDENGTPYFVVIKVEPANTKDNK